MSGETTLTFRAGESSPGLLQNALLPDTMPGSVMTRLSIRTASLLVALAVLQGCGAGGPPLPPVPTVDLAVMSVEVREQVGEALRRFEKDPENADRNGRLGMLLHAYGRHAEAGVFYDRARHLDPDRFRWTYLHGQMLSKTGQTLHAIAALERALEMRPGYPAAELELANLLATTDDYERAGTIYRQLTERNPGFARAHYHHGRFLLEQGDPAAALPKLEMALSLSNRFGKAHYTLSQVHRELGNPERAALHAALFERHRLFEPPGNDPLRLEIEAQNVTDFLQYQKALARVHAGRHGEALESLLALEKRDPDNVSIPVNLIAVYGELGDIEKARAAADRALALDRNSVAAWDNLGILHLKTGNLAEAELAFRNAVDVDPGYSVPHKNLGVLFEQRYQLDKALDSYARAVALDPYDRQARYLLGRAQLTDNQPEAAIETLEPISTADTPQLAEYLLALGTALDRAGRPDAAIETLQRGAVKARVRGDHRLADTITAMLDQVRSRKPR